MSKEQKVTLICFHKTELKYGSIDCGVQILHSLKDLVEENTSSSIFILHIWVFGLSVCMCTTHVWRVQMPERLSDPLSWSYRWSSLTIVGRSFCPSCHFQVTIQRLNSNYKSSACSSGLLQTNSHNFNSPVYINLHSDMWHYLSFILHLLFSSLLSVGNSDSAPFPASFFVWLSRQYFLSSYQLVSFLVKKKIQVTNFHTVQKNYFTAHHVCSGNWSQALCSSSKCYSMLGNPSCSKPNYFIFINTTKISQTWRYKCIALLRYWKMRDLKTSFSFSLLHVHSWMNFVFESKRKHFFLHLPCLWPNMEMAVWG